MSFLSDLFHGNFGNLGEDIAPQNIFKDTVSSFENQPEWAKIAEIALPAVALGGVGLGALADVGGVAAEGGLAAAEGAGTAVGGGEVLSDAAISDLMASPGAQAFGAIGGVADPTITGAGAGASVGAGTVGVGPADVAMGASVGDVAGVGNAGWLSTPIAPDAALTGGTYGGAAAPAAAPLDPAFSGFGTAPISNLGAGPTVFGSVPTPNVAPGFADQFGNVVGSIGSGLKSAAPWLGAAGLGFNLFQGYQQNQALKAEQARVQQQADAVAAAGQASLAAAQPDLAIGQALMTGGPVPGPMQAMLDQVRNAERARIIQGYGTRNQSTDPNQNSALAQDLNNLDTNLTAMRVTLGQQIVATANQLLSSGASAAQISENMAITMQKLDMQLEQMVGNSIANFAAAMSGGTMKIVGQGSGQNLNINLSGGTGQLAA